MFYVDCYRVKKSIILAVTFLVMLSMLSACGGSGSNSGGTTSTSSSLILISPNIIPSLPNKSGVNYVAVYNSSGKDVSNISYSLGQQVGSGSGITLDTASAAACATVASHQSCYLKLSVPAYSLAGGAVMTASVNNVPTSTQAIGIQQIYYTESSGADGVGLYFYPKVQYNSNGAPFVLITAVVLSSNVENVNTIQLVNQNGVLLTGQQTISDNSGSNKNLLVKGDVVTIELPIPQGAGLTQNFKVQTSLQLSSSANLNKVPLKLAQSGTNNISIGSVGYVLNTISNNNINLQLTPSQMFLTTENPIQSGYLYNIGNLSASQVQVVSPDSNVSVTTSNTVLSGQNVIQIAYKLLNTAVAPTSNIIYASGENPSGQSQISIGQAVQNVYPSVSPSPMPTPNPSPTPTPGKLTVSANANPHAGGTCSVITANTPSPVSVATFVTLSVASNANYGFAESANGQFKIDSGCLIQAGNTSCSTSEIDANNLCVAGSVPAGTPIAVVAAANSYTSNNTTLSVLAAPLSLSVSVSPRPYAGGSCGTVTATAGQTVNQDTQVGFTISGSGQSTYGFGSYGSDTFTSSSSCTIYNGSQSCSPAAGSICASSIMSAATPITVTATASTYPTASASTKVTASYMYMAVGGSGVTQCLVSESDGSPINCFTQDDKKTSVDLGFAMLLPSQEYIYLLNTSNNGANPPPGYYTCLMNESGTYDNDNCVYNTNFYGYRNIAFAPSGDTMFAYLAGTPSSPSTGISPSYCSVYQSTSLYCSQPTSSGTTSNSGGVVSLKLNGNNYVYVLPYQNLNATTIYQCNVTSSSGYGNDNCRAAFTTGDSSSAGGNIRSLAFTNVGTSYFAYISTGSPGAAQIYYCPVTQEGLIGLCTIIDEMGVMNKATNLGATNINNHPYLYFGSNEAHTVYYCPINTESDPSILKVIGNVGSDADYETCLQSDIRSNQSGPPSTVVNNISFGVW